MTFKGSVGAGKNRIIPTARRKLTVSAPLALDSSAPWRMERSCSVMSQQVWRWTLPILWLRPQPPLPPPNPRHRRTGCALARRASASWAAPVIHRLIITRDGVGQYSGRDKQHVTILSDSRLFGGASVSLRVICALKGSKGSLSTHKECPNCKLVKCVY